MLKDLFYMGNFVNTQVMPETPIQAVNIIFAIVGSCQSVSESNSSIRKQKKSFSNTPFH